MAREMEQREGTFQSFFDEASGIVEDLKSELEEWQVVVKADGTVGGPTRITSKDRRKRNG